ncbi:hypothetical protein BBP40_011518 [Aspergillus hancockii]|nr:hypothetical protein BBP40_011518 [Aspergillus hancockii]
MAPTLNILQARQASSDNCPDSISGGGIAGIVIGSIAGTLLLLWLWRVCSLPGAQGGGEPDYGYSSHSGGGYETRHRHRRRRSPSYYEYVEKPSVRRPAKVYLS